MRKIIVVILVTIVFLIIGYQLLKQGDEKPMPPVADPATDRLTSTGRVIGGMITFSSINGAVLMVFPSIFSSILFHLLLPL